jgi:nicotinamidase/pyrazinamidase
MDTKQSSLILVDLQNDFFPGGPLGISTANAIFPLANDIQEYFSLTIATKDWHPPNHKSFASSHPDKKIYDHIDLNGLSQVLWPDHCVQGSWGSEFHPLLRTDRIQKVIYKGTDPNIDSYSCFFDNAHQQETGLNTYLKELNITDVYIMGLATDFCVQYSVLDALLLGFKTFLIEDGCFGINQTPNAVEHSIHTMQKAGATIIQSTMIPQASSLNNLL